MIIFENYPSNEVVIIEVMATRLNTAKEVVWQRVESGYIEAGDLGPYNYRMEELAGNLSRTVTRTYTEDWGSDEY